MKFKEALIAWNPNSNQIEIGHLLRNHHMYDWTNPYRCTGGAAYIYNRKAESNVYELLLAEFQNIIINHNVEPQAVHKAFLNIDEYLTLVES